MPYRGYPRNIHSRGARKKFIIFAIVHSWITKILLFVAVIIIMAHNSIPHDHDDVSLSSHHEHDSDHDDDENEIISYDFLAHTFTQQTFGCSVIQHVVAEAQLVTITSNDRIPGGSSWFTKSFYSLKHEFPPPRNHLSSSGFCGPPYLI